MTRKLVYTGFMSLDGVLDSPGGVEEGHRSGGWVMETEFLPEAFALKGEELADTTALMFGRRSYEAFAPVWNGNEDHAAYQELPKFVVSSTITEADLLDGWGSTTILRSSEEVADLKQGNGGAIYIHGSAELARSLSEADLPRIAELMKSCSPCRRWRSMVSASMPGKRKVARRAASPHFTR